MAETPKKKLIEVSIPLDAINAAAKREKSTRQGHPSTLHLWWARRPLAVARAVLFAQLVDDPSAHPERYPSEADQRRERERLWGLMAKLVVWKNSNDQKLLARAHEEIRRSNGGELPKVLDPFAGGGTIPLEAQRLGLPAEGSDLNPVAVLITKALIELPPKFRDLPPVHPGPPSHATGYHGAEGLAEDVRYYGKWMRDEAFRRIGHLYPRAKAPDGTEHTVIAWIWARTVKSPNPANPIETPLVRSWWLSKRKGHEAYVVPHVRGERVAYEVRHDADGPDTKHDGTRNRRGGVSIADGTPFDSEYIKEQGRSGHLGAQMIAIVGEHSRSRLYLAPSQNQTDAAQVEHPAEIPGQKLPYDPRNVWTPPYGLTHFSDLFTNRQLVAMTTLSDLVGQARKRVLADARAALGPSASAHAGRGNVVHRKSASTPPQPMIRSATR